MNERKSSHFEMSRKSVPTRKIKFIVFENVYIISSEIKFTI